MLLPSSMSEETWKTYKIPSDKRILSSGLMLNNSPPYEKVLLKRLIQGEDQLLILQKQKQKPIC